MSSGNLTGLAAIVGKKRAQEADDATEAAPVMLEQEQTPERPAVRKPRRIATPEPTTGAAKYTDPNRVQLKTYVRRETKIDAIHKWQREGRGDASDLIEHLLTQYLSSK